MYLFALLLGLILPFSMPMTAGYDQGAATVDAGKKAYLPETENDQFFAILSDEIIDYRATPLNSDGVDDFVRLYLENFKNENGYDYTKSSPEELAAASFRVDDPALTEAGFQLFVHVEGESVSIADASYLIYDGVLYELGFAGFGGNALTGYAVADLNGDGQAELFHSFTWCGSGVPGAECLGCFDPADRKGILIYNQPLKFVNDGVQNICPVPVLDNGALKAAHGYGMWGGCIQDGELKMPIGKDYGEIVYENGEYAIKENA